MALAWVSQSCFFLLATHNKIQNYLESILKEKEVSRKNVNTEIVVNFNTTVEPRVEEKGKLTEILMLLGG